jgi:hypothetical protein
MNDHPANPQPGEVVRTDPGGWIPCPSISAEPVPAEQVRAGDKLLLNDGIRAEVTDVRHGCYWFADGRGQGVAIGWRSGGRTSGLLFRRTSDLLTRLAASR